MTAPVLALSPQGSVAVPLRFARGAVGVLTRCRIRLLTLIGEWPDDVTLGIPYFAWVTRQPTPLIEIQGAVAVQLEQVAGVVEVLSVTATRVGAEIRVAARLRVSDEDGSVIVADVASRPDFGARSAGAWYTLLGPGSGPLVG